MKWSPVILMVQFNFFDILFFVNFAFPGWKTYRKASKSPEMSIVDANANPRFRFTRFMKTSDRVRPDLNHTLKVTNSPVILCPHNDVSNSNFSDQLGSHFYMSCFCNVGDSSWQEQEKIRFQNSNFWKKIRNSVHSRKAWRWLTIKLFFSKKHHKKHQQNAVFSCYQRHLKFVMRTSLGTRLKNPS